MTGSAALPPTRRNVRSWMRWSSFACTAAGVSEISSKTSVPPDADSTSPGLCRHGAGEGPPLVAEQLGLKEVLGDTGAVGLNQWRRLLAPGKVIWRARTFLPVPVSPVMRIGTSACRRRRMMARIARISAHSPRNSTK